MDFKFLSTVRLPRDAAENQRHSPKACYIDRWISNILDAAALHEEKVTVLPELIGSNKLAIVGDTAATRVVSELIRAIIIEIESGDLENGTFSYEQAAVVWDFIEQKFDEYAASRKATELKEKLLTSRVDLKLSPHDMNNRQLDSYNRLRELFTVLSVNISSVENKPTVIELHAPDVDVLKTANLTARWAARQIADNHEITKNQMAQALANQSVQAVGKERAGRIREMALG